MISATKPNMYNFKIECKTYYGLIHSFVVFRWCNPVLNSITLFQIKAWILNDKKKVVRSNSITTFFFKKKKIYLKFIKKTKACEFKFLTKI